MKTISLEQAVAMIPNGASLMIGGFMAVAAEKFGGNHAAAPRARTG